MVNLRVNGIDHALDIEENMPLLWVLRDELGFTGTKFGCGIGQCGACTVHIGGVAVRSCQVDVSSVTEPVTTIEGLSDETERHPVQRAWIAHQVAQCGYCQSGQIMTAAALYDQNPSAALSEFEALLSENICRCASYAQMRAALEALIANKESD